MAKKNYSNWNKFDEYLSNLAQSPSVFYKWLSSIRQPLRKIFKRLHREKFSGDFVIQIKNGKLDIKLRPKYSKAQMMSIYARYSNYFESRRNEFIDIHLSEYGADKFAIQKTIEEIEKKESVTVSSANLKQAMTRILVRRPIKQRKNSNPN